MFLVMFDWQFQEFGNALIHVDPYWWTFYLQTSCFSKTSTMSISIHVHK